MYLQAISSDNLCFKWRFKPGALTGKTCQKWEDFMVLWGDWEKWNETGDHPVGRGELAGLWIETVFADFDSEHYKQRCQLREIKYR